MSVDVIGWAGRNASRSVIARVEEKWTQESVCYGSRTSFCRKVGRVANYDRKTNLPGPLRWLLANSCAHCLILLVRPLEVRDHMVNFEVPDARRHLIDQVVIVCHQQRRTLIALQCDIQCID
jgi:hypothetical protein